MPALRQGARPKGPPLVRRLPDAPQARKLERRWKRNGKHMNQRYTMNNPTQFPSFSMRSPWACLGTSLKRFGWLLSVVVLCCVSCATEKKGIWDVVYRERIQNDYEIFLLRHENSVQFYAEYKGDPICETEICPNPAYTSSLVFPFCADDRTGSRFIYYGKDKGIFTTIACMPQGSNTVSLLDQDGDGYPEWRLITSFPANREVVCEELAPQVISSETASGTVPQKENLEMP